MSEEEKRQKLRERKLETYHKNKERISLIRSINRYRNSNTIPKPNSRLAYYCVEKGYNIQEILASGLPKDV